MITLTSSFGLDSAFASRLGAMNVDGEAFFASFDEPLSATAAIGAASATTAIVIRSRPRPPLPQRAFERDSPPRFPVPHSALERMPLGASKSFRAIPLPFPSAARAAGTHRAAATGVRERAERRLVGMPTHPPSGGRTPYKRGISPFRVIQRGAAQVSDQAKHACPWPAITRRQEPPSTLQMLHRAFHAADGDPWLGAHDPGRGSIT